MLETTSYAQDKAQMADHVDGRDLPHIIEAVANMLMSLANEAESRDAQAIALVSRDAVEALFVVLDTLAGPNCEALATY